MKYLINLVNIGYLRPTNAEPYKLTKKEFENSVLPMYGDRRAKYQKEGKNLRVVSPVYGGVSIILEPVK